MPGDTPAARGPGRPAPARPLRSAVRTVWTAALAFHAAAVVVMTLPADSALSRMSYGPLFRWYATVTGVSQNWNMFDSIPDDHAFEVRGVARDRTGAARTFGPVLPDLRAVDRRSFRYHSFFRRIDTGAYTAYRAPYLARLRRALEARQGRLFPEVTVTVTHHRLRALRDIRRDGRIARRVERQLGPE